MYVIQNTMKWRVCSERMIAYKRHYCVYSDIHSHIHTSHTHIWGSFAFCVFTHFQSKIDLYISLERRHYQQDVSNAVTNTVNTIHVHRVKKEEEEHSLLISFSKKRKKTHKKQILNFNSKLTANDGSTIKYWNNNTRFLFQKFILFKQAEWDISMIFVLLTFENIRDK